MTELAPIEAYVAPARARPALWRLLAGCVVICIAWFGALVSVAPTLKEFAKGHQLHDPALLTIGFLYAFGGMIAGTALAVRLFQRRSFRSVFGPGGFRPGLFGLAVAIWGGFALLSLALLHGVLPLEPGVPLPQWLRHLPFAIPAVLIQCAAEEIAFRGFLMQTLAARFRSRLVWLGLPALVFGALHFDPATHGANAWLVAASAGLIGLVLGDITARLGNLSAAIGLHFVNNAVALLLVSPPTPLGGLSLFLLDVSQTDASGLRALHLSDMATTLVCYGAWFLIWGRRLGPTRLPRAGHRQAEAAGAWSGS